MITGCWFECFLPIKLTEFQTSCFLLLTSVLQQKIMKWSDVIWGAVSAYYQEDWTGNQCSQIWVHLGILNKLTLLLTGSLQWSLPAMNGMMGKIQNVVAMKTNCCQYLNLAASTNTVKHLKTLPGLVCNVWLYFIKLAGLCNCLTVRVSGLILSSVSPLPQFRNMQTRQTVILRWP